jgi:hypothetical protein
MCAADLVLVGARRFLGDDNALYAVVADFAALLLDGHFVADRQIVGKFH